MNGNEFPKNELKNGMFGAVEFAPGKLKWFVLIKEEENKFLMVYQEGGSDMLGDDETDTF